MLQMHGSSRCAGTRGCPGANGAAHCSCSYHHLPTVNTPPRPASYCTLVTDSMPAFSPTPSVLAPNWTSLAFVVGQDSLTEQGRSLRMLTAIQGMSTDNWDYLYLIPKGKPHPAFMKVKAERQKTRDQTRQLLYDVVSQHIAYERVKS